MGKQKYNWLMARQNLASANVAIHAAVRHCQHGKRVNVLNDIHAAEQALRAAWFHLSEEHRAADAVAGSVAEGTPVPSRMEIDLYGL